MPQEHSTQNSRVFKHLTQRERYQIEFPLKNKKKPQEIVGLLGKHKRTMEQEIARRTVPADQRVNIRELVLWRYSTVKVYKERAQPRGGLENRE